MNGIIETLEEGKASNGANFIKLSIKGVNYRAFFKNNEQFNQFKENVKIGEKYKFDFKESEDRRYKNILLETFEKDLTETTNSGTELKEYTREDKIELQSVLKALTDLPENMLLKILEDTDNFLLKHIAEKTKILRKELLYKGE